MRMCGTDCRQRGPGLVTRGEEGEASWTLDLIPQLGSIRVHLSGGGSDHTQSVVDVHQRQSCKTDRHTQTQHAGNQEPISCTYNKPVIVLFV